MTRSCIDRTTSGLARPRACWLLCLLLLSACAAGPNSELGSPNAAGIVAGFWLGLWHGIIAPITFVISLFERGVGLYEVHNNGAWYNFGFLLGLTCWSGSSHGVRRSRSERRD